MGKEIDHTGSGHCGMPISAGVYSVILEHPYPGHETGGLLGGKNGIIENVLLDQGIQSDQEKHQYEPDVERFNKQLIQWSASEIEFMGIFHTHAANYCFLSEEDRNYIKKIAAACKGDGRVLYFPILSLPERRLTAYEAQTAMDGRTQIIRVPIRIMGKFE